jgi:hypothetical protein
MYRDRQIMPAGLLRAALPAVLACMLGLPCARADVYAWIDASGTVVLSDLAPPPGARVIDVVADNAAPVATRAAVPASYDAARQAEIEFLTERVRLLERTVELGSRQPVPAAQYGTGPPPGINNGWCDPPWSYCGPWWGPAVYPGVIVVPRSSGFRGFARFHRGQRFVVPPARVSKGFRVR